MGFSRLFFSPRGHGRLVIVSLALGLVCFPAASSAAAGEPPRVEIPDTPAGRQLTRFLEAINSGEAGPVRALVTEQFSQPFREMVPLEQHLEILGGLQQESGGLEVLKVESSSQHSIVVVGKERSSERRLRLEIGVAPTPPHLIDGIQVEPAPGSAEPTESGPLSEAEIVAQMQALVEKLAEQDRFSGAILLAKDGDTVWETCYGVADDATQAPNRINTKFNLGSINKIFTAVAIAQLAEAGKLSFADPISKHLPAFPREVGEKVTIRQLLNHTSGMGQFWGEEFERRRLSLRTVSDYLDLIKDQPLAFEPGARRQYSNNGYILLGAIIEAVSGQSYFDYVRRHIYEPVGMNDTGEYEIDHRIENLAIGYEVHDGARVENTGRIPVKGTPAGGGYSTVSDLARFAEALDEHKLLSRQFTELLWKTIRPEGKAGGKPGPWAIAGGAPGVSAFLLRIPAQGYTLVVLMNYGGGNPIFEQLEKLVSRAA